jgi:hypothetical protein
MNGTFGSSQKMPANLIARCTVENIHRVLWPILCWAVVAGTFLASLVRQRVLILALAWVPIGYLLSSAFIEQFVPRFNVAVAPFIAAVSIVPLAIIAQFASRKWVESNRNENGSLSDPKD